MKWVEIEGNFSMQEVVPTTRKVEFNQHYYPHKPGDTFVAKLSNDTQAVVV